MLNATHLQDWVIAPALDKLNLWSRSAEELVLGTAIVESGLNFIVQFVNSSIPHYDEDGIRRLKPSGMKAL